MTTNEEARALIYRDQQARQAAAKRAANARMAAPPAPYQALRGRWRAVELWLSERRVR